MRHTEASLQSLHQAFLNENDLFALPIIRPKLPDFDAPKFITDQLLVVSLLLLDHSQGDPFAHQVTEFSSSFLANSSLYYLSLYFASTSLRTLATNTYQAIKSASL